MPRLAADNVLLALGHRRRILPVEGLSCQSVVMYVDENSTYDAVVFRLMSPDIGHLVPQFSLVCRQFGEYFRVPGLLSVLSRHFFREL